MNPNQPKTSSNRVTWTICPDCKGWGVVKAYCNGIAEYTTTCTACFGLGTQPFTHDGTPLPRRPLHMEDIP